MVAFARELRDERIGSGFVFADAVRREAGAEGGARAAENTAREHRMAGRSFVEALEERSFMDPSEEKRTIAKAVSSYMKAARLFENMEDYENTAACYRELQVLMEGLGNQGEERKYAAMRCVALKKAGQDHIAQNIMRAHGIGRDVRSMLSGETIRRRDAFAPSLRCA